MAENCTQNQTLPLIRPRSVDSWILGTGGYGGMKAYADPHAEHLSRTNGWAAGFAVLEMDRLVGSHYRLSSLPDAKLLKVSPEVAGELAGEIESEWSLYSNSTFVDAARRRTFTQMLREAVRSDVLYGEVFLVRQWRQNPSGYSTCFQLVNPSRICNPNNTMNSANLKNGIETDRYGTPVAYWVRNRHPGDTIQAGEMDTWERITAFNRFGVQQVIHISDQLSADQTRGISRLAPIFEDLQRLSNYEKSEEDAAQLAAMLTMAITSDYGQASAFDALGVESIKANMAMRAAFHGEKSIEFAGSRIPHLFQGEKIQAISSEHPSTAYGEHRSAVLGRIARGLSSSWEELTGDFSKTSYSSARASIDVADRSGKAKKASFVDRVANMMFGLWFYEALVKNRVSAVDPQFILSDWRNQQAAAMCKWVGAARITIDPLKAAKAREINLKNGVTTLAEVCAEDGNDFEEVIAQRKREHEMLIDAGLMMDPADVEDDAPGDPSTDPDVDETPPGRAQPQNDN